MGPLFAGFLSFILSVQFTIGTFPISVSSAQAQSCPAGQSLDPIVGRCLSSAQASQVAQATTSCKSAGDEAAQRKCYLSAAEAALADAEAKGEVEKAGKVSPDMMSMILTLGGLVSSVMFLATGASAGCGPFTTSAMIIAASSMAAFSGELLASMTYKKKMKDANETLKKINDGSAGTTKTGANSEVMNATNVQAEAFDALIKKEEAVIAAAKTKQKLYTLAMMGYTAATVMAGIEVAKMVLPGGAAATACKAASLDRSQTNETMVAQYLDNYFLKNQQITFQAYTQNSSLKTSGNITDLQASLAEMALLRSGGMQSLSSEYYAESKRLNDEAGMNFDQNEFSMLKTLMIVADNMLIGSAHAAGPMVQFGQAGAQPLATAAPVAAGAPASVGAIAGPVTPQVTGVAKALRTLYTSPVPRLALSAVLMANAMKAKGKAGKEADKAKDRKALLEKLRDQVVDSSGVNAGLKCGSADAAQASAACRSTTPEIITPTDASSNPNLASANFGVTPGDPSDGILTTPKCITNTGSFDPSCTCKSNNSCLNVASNIVTGVPSGLSLGSVGSDLDSINGGRLAGASLDEAQLTSAAARLNKMNDALAKKNPEIKKAQDQAKKDAAELTSKLSGQVGASAPSLASSGSGDSNGSLDAKSPEQALEQLKSDIQQEIGKVEGSGSGAEGTGSGLDISGVGDLNGDETPVSAGAEKLAEVMASEYEMGNNDITTDSSSSIFDIVSNRYKRSGIRRLFGSESLLPADKAAPNDIAK